MNILCFRMSLNDFLQQFNKVITCTVGPDFDGNGTADLTTRGNVNHCTHVEILLLNL